MSWVSIGGAVFGGVVVGEYQKGIASKQQQTQREQMGLTEKLSEEQLVQRQAELLGRERGQEEALGRATGIRRVGESEFERATTGTPPAIEQLQTLIRERALPEQQQALAQTKLGLSQAGVRGPEAGLIAQQQASKMGLDLSRAVEEIALKQALADREKRAAMAGTKAMAGLAQELRPIEKFGKSFLDIKNEQEKKKRDEELSKTVIGRLLLEKERKNNR